ncbi:hypothetical protein OIU79_020530 [Salix purpurea]|uniref:Uncharacterized protein n=1 Tax=Salix purpurea TaxID=77065 RepID=A0A9Q0WMC7_SALPP|nr:hypothetical protein OIU79_020530 [Salix purpurea]
MSKKKAFSGHTMSLKDFHVALSLLISLCLLLLLSLAVSAGFESYNLYIDFGLRVKIIRSHDWTGHDRPNSWGGRMSRPDHWVRPHSSPATRHCDDKTPFLSRNIRIDRNFDEEERKPLDGFSGSRRTFSDESFQVAPRKVELMPALSVQLAGSYMAASAAESHARRVHERAHVEMHLQNVGDTGGLRVGGSYAKAWTVRRQLVMGIDEPLQPTWSETSAVSKDRAPLHSELKERNPLPHVDRDRLPCSDAKSGGSIVQPPVRPEASERPKVKLLPRTKPLEISELPVPHHMQENQLPSHLAHGYAITSEELRPNVDAAKPPSVGVETENQMFERQKLNLKPRSPPLEQIEWDIERER